MGSETTCAPLGIMIDVFPENVSGTDEPGTICGVPAAPSSGMAIATCVMGKSFTPNAFEMRKRMYDSATIDVWMVWRIVEFVKIELVPFCAPRAAASVHEHGRVHMRTYEGRVRHVVVFGQLGHRHPGVDPMPGGHCSYAQQGCGGSHEVQRGTHGRSL